MSSPLHAAACTALALLAVLCNSRLASASAHGKATFYTDYLPSACFEYDRGQFPADKYFAAASDALWKGGAVCGHYYWVWCKSGCTNKNAIKVRIVDNCPSSAGCTSTFDLSKEAFSAMADLRTGVIEVGYKLANSG